MSIPLIYTISLLVGVVYTITAFLLGGIAGLGHGEGGGGDFSHDYGTGPDMGHGEATGGAGGGEQVIFGPFSPIVIAFFLTCFGGTGLILTSATRMNQFATLFLAGVSGFILAWLMVRIFNSVLGNIQSSSEVRLHSLIGVEAEVTVSIPPAGFGEIAYIAMGSRNTAPARSEDQQSIPRYSAVRITRIVGNLFFVRPVLEEQLRAMSDAPVETTAGAEKSE